MPDWRVPLADVVVPERDIDVVADVYRSGNGTDWTFAATLTTPAGFSPGLMNGGELLPLTIRKLPPGTVVHGPRMISQQTALTLLQIMRSNVSCTCGSGKSANIPGLNVGGKTGTGDKFDPAIRHYSTTKQVSSFAAVFPTDGPLDAPRYFVLILLDEPQKDKTGLDPTGGIVAAPAAGKVIERIAPFLGVKRRAETNPFTPAVDTAADTGEDH